MSLYKNIIFFIYIQNKRPELVLTLWVCYTGLLQGLILV